MTRDQSRIETGLCPRARARRACAAAGLPLLLLALGGCGALGGTKPTSVNGNLQAAANLNPSVSDRPSPLTLRVYELRSDTAFNRADFMSLYQSEQTALGGDVVAREELTLQPGENRPYSKQLNAETRFIGVFAAYRNLEKARWRAVAAVVPGRAQKVAIRAESLAVTLLVQP